MSTLTPYDLVICYKVLTGSISDTVKSAINHTKYVIVNNKKEIPKNAVMSMRSDLSFFNSFWKDLVPEFIKVVIKINLKKICNMSYNPATIIHDL